MRRNPLILIIILCMFPVFLIAQDSTTHRQNLNSLFGTRFRMQTGGFNIKYDVDEFKRELWPILNVNYRMMMTNQDTSQDFHVVDLVSELGTNFIIIPYYKIGPELHLSENIYVDLHAGLTFPLVARQLVTPFVGVDMGYIVKLGSASALEIGVGYDASEIAIRYFSIGYTIW